MDSRESHAVRLLLCQSALFAQIRRAARSWVWAVPAAALTVGAAGAATKDDIRHIVEEERTRGGTPAMSVAVVRDGQVLVEFASGLADREANRAATLDTQYPAASVSKILTAALVMRQVEEQRLDLDIAVNNYLKPAFRVRNSAGEPVPVTLRQLLSHSSGLPVSWNGIVDWGNAVPTMEEQLAKGQNTLHLPGERIVYANNGFALAGYVAAQAAGKTFSDYAREALFQPLGMTRSTFESPWQLGNDLATAYGHWFQGGSDRTYHADLTAMAPAGGLVTSASDLARFALMILGEGELEGVRILRPDSVAQMLRLQARAHPDLDEGFGLGFAVRVQRGQRLAWWDGSSSGAASRLALLPDAKVGVVVLSNLANNEPPAIAGRRILDMLVPAPVTTAYKPSAENLDRAAGFYRPSDFLDPEYWYLKYLLAFEIGRKGGTLIKNSLITGESALSPIGPDRFRIQGSWLDNSTVLFDGDTMYLGHLRAHRISSWQSPSALLFYAALITLAVASLLGWVVWRAIRLLRRTQIA